MKHYKEITQTVKEHDKTTCDICGCDIYEETRHSRMPTLTRDVTIEYDHGENWPDDCSYYHFRPDICGKCFREKIYPHILPLLNPESLAWIDEWDKYQHDCMSELLDDD